MSKPLWASVQDEFADLYKPKGKRAFVYRFKDTRDAMGVTGSRRVFTHALPSDFLVTEEGVTFYAEVKSTIHEVSFNLGNVATAQWNAAIQCTAAGGLYFFFIKSDHLQAWYKVPAAFLITVRKERKSVRWAELAQFIWR